MNVSFDFRHRNVVITGAGRGIGFEIAHRFLLAGARVEVWEHAQDLIENAQEQFRKLGFTESQLSLQTVDVANASSCRSAAQKIPFAIDILVNNAGITRDKTLTKMTDEDFDSVIKTNLSGVFYVTQACLPYFNQTHQSKRIINIASVVALYGNFGQTNYVASKAGVIGMTKTWARELGRKGFTSNAIAPGFTRTSMVDQMPEDVRQGLQANVPAGRLGEPLDIAQACLFLASDAGSYINGATLSVDGGLIC